MGFPLIPSQAVCPFNSHCNTLCRVDLYMAIGKPIVLPKIREPAPQEVERYLQAFIAALQNLYQKHQGKAGYPHSKLVVM